MGDMLNALFDTSEGELRYLLGKRAMSRYHDASLPPGAYLGMAQGLGDHDLIEMEGGYETLFTNPTAIAEALLKAVK